MKIWKAINLSIVVIAIAAVILPFSIIHGAPVSKPALDLLGLGTKMNGWVDENAELRKDISRTLKYRVAHLSPSESLHLGKDGWVYYTLGYNLEIAKGTYPLEQSQLDFQAATFSNVKKYYELMGADFYFLSYPAKTSIYPEYIQGGNWTVGASPSDIVINNLKSRTDINTILPKPALIEAKATNKLYQKMDVHANDYGEYITYQTICSEISRSSGIDMTPVNVRFVDGEYPIGSNEIAGVDNLFGKSETGPVAVYDAKAQRVTEGELYEAVEEICAQEKYAVNVSKRAIFENPDAPNGTLLIYGTSMFYYDNIGEMWQLTRYLAENFKRVVYMGSNTCIIPAIDSLVKPDVVIIENPERYSNLAGYRDTSLVPIVADLTDIELVPLTETINSIGNNGMYLDYFGSQLLKNNSDPLEIKDENSIVLSGWAEDSNTQLPLSALYLRLGDRVFQCNYGNGRPGLADALGYPAEANKAGFSIEIPRVFFEGVSAMEFIMIGTDGSYQYAPVTYPIK